MNFSPQRRGALGRGLLAAFIFYGAVFGWAISIFAAPKTRVSLLLSAQAAQPGEVIWAGVELDMPTPWHIYWRNGGDAGEPVQITWHLPPGITAGEIHWPVPVKEIDTSGDTSLITYVYTNEVILLVPLTVDAKTPLTSGQTLSASVKWMECSDICVMGARDAATVVDIATNSVPSPQAKTLAQWQTNLPQTIEPGDATAGWEEDGQKTSERHLLIEWKTAAAEPDFYPYATIGYDIQGMTRVTQGANGTVQLRKVVKMNDAAWPTELNGILVGRTDNQRQGREIHLTIGHRALSAAGSEKKAPAPPSASLIAMLCLAFLGGLILNVMPCVLPVIALKILGFVNQSTEEPRRVRWLGLVYAAGVLVSFLVLAGLAMGVQRAGGVANWGDAFHNPQFLVVFTILMTLVALNLFGVFEVTVGGKALGAASELSGRAGFSGAFFNGVLATLLATPCTAPFLGVALAFAFTQPWWVILAVFLSAGLGLAFPFALLCWNPRLLKLLPRPGAWMERFKIAMGFPMLATAVWLMWVASRREDDELWLGLFLVVLTFAAWLWGQFVQKNPRHSSVVMIICLTLLVVDYLVILEGQLHWRAGVVAAQTGIQWHPWSADAVAEAQRQGHPVLVDFTAKSCLTCKLNLASSLEIERTKAELKKIGAVTLKADDTYDDPAIGRELRRFNTSGVPLVLVYSHEASRPPQVMPTFLTPSIVFNALDAASR